MSGNTEPGSPGDNAGFVAHWKRVGPERDRILVAELDRMTQEEHWLRESGYLFASSVVSL